MKVAIFWPFVHFRALADFSMAIRSELKCLQLFEDIKNTEAICLKSAIPYGFQKDFKTTHVRKWTYGPSPISTYSTSYRSFSIFGNPRRHLYEKKWLTPKPNAGYCQTCRLIPGALSPPRVVIPDTQKCAASFGSNALLVCNGWGGGSPETMPGSLARVARKTNKIIDRWGWFARLKF